MTQTPLQQLTAKIYTSNPELMTLGVGCEFKMYDENYTCIAIIDGSVYYESDLGIEEADVDYIQHNETDCEIIGKPPTLVDVRNWIKLKVLEIHVKLDAYLRLMQDWNNSIYLRDQSPELINFLINLNNG